MSIKMNKGIYLIAFVAMLSCSKGGQAQEPSIEGVEWQKGESIGDLEGIAQIRVPSGYLFADGDETRIIMEAMENLTNGSEMGFVAPSSLDWFVVFEFDETGYVPDDEKDSLDVGAMLRSMKQGDKLSNEERQQRGYPALYTLGWEQ